MQPSAEEQHRRSVPAWVQALDDEWREIECDASRERIERERIAHMNDPVRLLPCYATGIPCTRLCVQMRHCHEAIKKQKAARGDAWRPLCFGKGIPGHQKAAICHEGGGCLFEDDCYRIRNGTSERPPKCHSHIDRCTNPACLFRESCQDGYEFAIETRRIIEKWRARIALEAAQA